MPAPVPAPHGSPAQEVDINWENVPQMPAQKVPGIEAIPLTSAEKKKAPSAAAGPDVVSGFGNDLPLLVALQQVVPPQYKVSLAQGVDGNTHVSWQGDKPWEQALSDMLSPVLCSFSHFIQGNTLVVKAVSGNNESSAPAHLRPPEKRI